MERFLTITYVGTEGIIGIDMTLDDWGSWWGFRHGVYTKDVVDTVRAVRNNWPDFDRIVTKHLFFPNAKRPGPFAYEKAELVWPRTANVGTGGVLRNVDLECRADEDGEPYPPFYMVTDYNRVRFESILNQLRTLFDGFDYKYVYAKN